MTDNEIIKDLEEEIHLVEYVDGFYSEHADIEMLKGCLDIINHQNTEIDRLKNELHGKVDYIHEQVEIIEQLKSQREMLLKECKRCGRRKDKRTRKLKNQFKTAKAKAIKEFAEKLKQQAFNCDISFGFGKEHYTKAVALLDIDKLVEEMTESEGE